MGYAVTSPLDSTPPRGHERPSSPSDPPDPDEDTQVLATFDPASLTVEQRARVRRLARADARERVREQAFEATLLRLLRRYGKWILGAIVAAAAGPIIERVLAWVLR